MSDLFGRPRSYRGYVLWLDRILGFGHAYSILFLVGFLVAARRRLNSGLLGQESEYETGRYLPAVVGLGCFVLGYRRVDLSVYRLSLENSRMMMPHLGLTTPLPVVVPILAVMRPPVSGMMCH